MVVRIRRISFSTYSNDKNYMASKFSELSLMRDGDPGGTRTPYLQIRNLSLYPDELRDHAIFIG